MKKSFKTILSHDDLSGELPVVVKPNLDKVGARVGFVSPQKYL
jgi:hypothetical protein